MDKAQSRRTYPYVVAGAILLLGLGISVGIYLTAGLEPDDLPWEFTSQSKKYSRALRFYGGTTNALLVELNDWFRGLWHGKPLAVTVAVISLGIALVYLFFATRGPLTERNEDPTNPSGNPRSG